MAMWFGKNNGNDRVQITHAAQYDVTTAVTVSAWINVQTLNVTPSSFTEYFTNNDFYHLYYSVSSTNSAFSFQYAGPLWRSLNDGVTPTLNVWFHLLGTYDNAAAGNNMILYRNGVSVASARYTDAISTTSGNVSIGSLNSSRYLRGILADCRFYNRALSANEAATIYASQGHDGIYSGLIARYILNEGYDGQVAGPGSSTVIDSSDYKNHGTTYND